MCTVRFKTCVSKSTELNNKLLKDCLRVDNYISIKHFVHNFSTIISTKKYIVLNLLNVCFYPHSTTPIITNTYFKNLYKER